MRGSWFKYKPVYLYCHLVIIFLTFFVSPDPPVVLSPPHFYQSDKSLLKAVHGLNPEKSKHETYVDIEPVSRVIQQVN